MDNYCFVMVINDKLQVGSCKVERPTCLDFCLKHRYQHVPLNIIGKRSLCQRVSNSLHQ